MEVLEEVLPEELLRPLEVLSEAAPAAPPVDAAASAASSAAMPCQSSIAGNSVCVMEGRGAGGKYAIST